MSWLPALLMLALVGVAAAMDLREHRVPNELTVAGLVLGLALQTGLPAGQGLFAPPPHTGGLGLATASATAGAVLLAGVLLWKVRVFGAGDAKLLVALAPWLGPSGAVLLVAFAFIAGGVLAVLALRRAGATLSGASRGWRSKERFAFAPAIGAAAVLVALAQRGGWTGWWS